MRTLYFAAYESDEICKVCNNKMIHIGDIKNPPICAYCSGLFCLQSKNNNT